MKTIMKTIQEIYADGISTSSGLSILDTDGAKWKLRLVGFDGTPDCEISHFGKNIYFRTNKGMKRSQYKTYGTLKAAVKKRMAEFDYTFDKLLYMCEGVTTEL